MTWARQRDHVQKLMRQKSGKKNDYEHEMQKDFRKWFDMAVPNEYRKRIFAIPNGGKRNVKVAKKLNAEGQRKGVLDLCLPVAKQGYIGFWIEFKYGKNTLTKEQRDWAKFLKEQGHRVEVCYTLDEAIAVTKDYLGMK